MKKVFLLATALAAIVSCTSDDFVGENNNSQNPNPAPDAGEKAIVFNSGAKTVTRADYTGADAANMLNNNFVFAGTKGENPTSYVFDQYNANWVTNTANTTQSNSNDWEYVGYTPATTTSLTSGAIQSIKYWDYSTTQYDFAAYSLGVATGNPAATAEAGAIAAGTKSYTLTGTADQLKNCYISDLVTAYNRDGVNDYGNVVSFSFRSMATKIRLAFYETIPGYSVKNIQFYSVAENGTASSTPTLFTSSAVLPSGSGTMTISFPTTGFDKRPGGSEANTDYNKAHVSFAQASGVSAASTVTFGGLADFANAEKYETASDDPATGWIGRASNSPTYAGGLDNGSGKYYTILPFETGANLQLRINYTLVSTDGSNEIINVSNATAVIPAELAKWNPNFAYTYIFKISDMTNGSTGFGPDGLTPVYGLTPITLNAVVVDSEDGIQETITTVSTPSITTYTKGKVVTGNDEYLTGAPIYVIVNNGTSNVAYDADKFKLYTATIEDGAAQTLQEASVDNALRYGTYSSENKTYTVTDANTKKLVVTESTLLAASTKIEAADSPTGNEITVSGAKFTPTATGNYVFAYLKSAGSATATTADYDATATYYSITPTRTGFYLEKTPTADEIADWGSYKASYTTNPTQPVYTYKMIKVVQ